MVCHQGIVKYDCSSTEEIYNRFTNFSDHQYFKSQRFWSVFADSKGVIWAGSVSEIFRFSDNQWQSFKLPFPEEVKGEFITKGTTWSITEDSKGNIWFSTNGYGAYKYDGHSFTQYTTADGLTDDSVDNIMEDSNEDMWFGTRYGGVSRYDGDTFTNYSKTNSIGNNEVCVIYEDSERNVWFSSEGYGVYRYDLSLAEGAENLLTNYSQEQGLGVKAVQAIFEDREGRLWVGGGGGLYRYVNSALPVQESNFINVTRAGPWN